MKQVYIRASAHRKLEKIAFERQKFLYEILEEKLDRICDEEIAELATGARQLDYKRQSNGRGRK